MAGQVKFFEVSNVLDLGNDWCPQSSTMSETKDREVGLCEGDEAASQLYNETHTGSTVFKNYSEDGSLVLPSVGEIIEGYHVDSLSVALNETAHPEMTTDYHKHHTAHSECRTYTPTVVIPAGFGVPTEIKDTDDGTVFKLTGLGVGLKSMTYTLTATHVDETAKNGTWIAGDTHNGNEVLEVEFVGKVEAGDMTIGSGWDVTVKDNGDDQTAADTSSITMTRGVKHDADNGGGGGGGE